MDSLLASYASSDEEENEAPLAPPPAQRITPAKPVRSEAKAEDDKEDDFLPKPTSKGGGLFNSLPPPKSSLFNSLPPPKSGSFSNPKPQAESERQREVSERDEQITENSKPKSSSSSLFSSLPQPKSSSAAASSAAAKRVVQFKPPSAVNPYAGGVDDEDDDEDEGEKERQRKRSKGSISTLSPSSFLSSIPAPRHSATLGAMPSALGTGRRSVLETENPSSGTNTVGAADSDAAANSNVGQPSETNYDYSSWSSGSESHAYYSGYGVKPDHNVGPVAVSSAGTVTDEPHESYDQSSGFGGESYAYDGAYGVGSTPVNGVSTSGGDNGMHSNPGSYEAVDYSYGNGHVDYTNYGADYGNNATHEYNWPNGTALPEVSGGVGNALPLPGKRGRKDDPPQIIEVKQDELMKNRPREDQVKMTGIAFGPAYQPASTKGKPTKLHKRKHQIGSLYFEMKQKEMELAERRSKGFLTKAQTQAKYGW